MKKKEKKPEEKKKAPEPKTAASKELMERRKNYLKQIQEQRARENKHAAQFGPELLPFIEAHAQRGDWHGALALSREASAIISEMEPLLCSTWSRLSELPAADVAAIGAAREEWHCPGSWDSNEN